MQARHVLQDLQQRQRIPRPRARDGHQRVTVQVAITLSDPSQLEKLAIQGSTIAGVRIQEHGREKPYTMDISGDDSRIEGTTSFTSEERRGSHSSKILEFM